MANPTEGSAGQKQDSEEKGKKITVHNASSFSAYELRQELNRRGAFDFKDEDTVNFRSLLRRLMVELVKDEEEAAKEKEKESCRRQESEREKQKRLREEKKRDAMERSKQRQADPDYFKKISEKNKMAEKDEATKQDDSSSHKTDSDDENRSEVGEDAKKCDPFQSFVPNGRPKVFVR